MSFFPAQGKGEGHHSLPCCEGHHNSESVMIPFHSQHTQPPLRILSFLVYSQWRRYVSNARPPDPPKGFARRSRNARSDWLRKVSRAIGVDRGGFQVEKNTTKEPQKPCLPKTHRSTAAATPLDVRRVLVSSQIETFCGARDPAAELFGASLSSFIIFIFASRSRGRCVREFGA